MDRPLSTAAPLAAAPGAGDCRRYVGARSLAFGGGVLVGVLGWQGRPHHRRRLRLRGPGHLHIPGALTRAALRAALRGILSLEPTAAAAAAAAGGPWLLGLLGAGSKQAAGRQVAAVLDAVLTGRCRHVLPLLQYPPPPACRSSSTCVTTRSLCSRWGGVRVGGGVKRNHGWVGEWVGQWAGGWGGQWAGGAGGGINLPTAAENGCKFNHRRCCPLHCKAQPRP